MIPAVYVVATVVFVPYQLEAFEAPKAAIVRAAGLALLTHWLLMRGWRRLPPWHVIDVALAGLVLLEIASTVASVDPVLSVLGETRHREGLLTTLGLAGVYALLRTSPTVVSERALRAGLLAAAGSGVYAVLQAAGLDPLHWQGEAEVGSTQALRAFGTLGHPNHLGVVTAGLTGAALALSIARQVERWLWAPLLLLLATATLLTFSRAAWLGLVASVGIVLVMHSGAAFRQLGSRKWVVLALVALAGTFLAFAMGLLQLGPWSRLLAERFEQLAQLQGGARVEMWRAAWELGRGAPWLGTGPDTFALTFPAHETVEYFRIEWGRQPLHAHSLPVHLVATRGMLAGALLLLIVWGAVMTVRRARSAPEKVSVSLAVLFGCGVASLFGSPSVTGALWLVFALAGLASQNAFSGSTSAVRQRADPEWGEGGRDAAHKTAYANARAAAHPPWSVRVVPAGVLLVTLAFAVWEARASWAAQHAERIRRVDRALGIEFARRSRAMVPFDETLHRIYVESLLFSLEKGNVPEVRTAAVQASEDLVRRWPRRAMNHQRRALAQLAVVLSGDSTAVGSMDSSFVRAAALAPNNALFTVERARALRLIGEHARARALLEPLTRRFPERGLPWAELAEIHFAQNDLQAAHACLRRAVEGRWREQHLALHRAQQRLRQLEMSPR